MRVMVKRYCLYRRNMAWKKEAKVYMLFFIPEVWAEGDNLIIALSLRLKVYV